MYDSESRRALLTFLLSHNKKSQCYHAFLKKFLVDVIVGLLLVENRPAALFDPISKGSEQDSQPFVRSYIVYGKVRLHATPLRNT